MLRACTHAHRAAMWEGTLIGEHKSRGQALSKAVTFVRKTEFRASIISSIARFARWGEATVYRA